MSQPVSAVIDCYLGTGAPQVIWPDIASQLN